jgi:hypothetical protein
MTSDDVKDLSPLVGATCKTETLGHSSLHETVAQHFKRAITANGCPNLWLKYSSNPFEMGLLSSNYADRLLS